jgi:hypothetical protein
MDCRAGDPKVLRRMSPGSLWNGWQSDAEATRSGAEAWWITPNDAEARVRGSETREALFLTRKHPERDAE